MFDPTHSYRTTSCAPLNKLEYAAISTRANLWSLTTRFWPTSVEFYFSLSCKVLNRSPAMFTHLHDNMHIPTHALLHIHPYSTSPSKAMMFFSNSKFCFLFKTQTHTFALQEKKQMYNTCGTDWPFGVRKKLVRHVWVIYRVIGSSWKRTLPNKKGEIKGMWLCGRYACQKWVALNRWPENTN